VCGRFSKNGSASIQGFGKLGRALIDPIQRPPHPIVCSGSPYSNEALPPTLFDGGRKGKRGLSSPRAQCRASAALRPCSLPTSDDSDTTQLYVSLPSCDRARCRRATTATRRNAVRLAAFRRLRQDAQRFASLPSAARGAAHAHAHVRRAPGSEAETGADGRCTRVFP
jgi:hypothetical protein